MSREEREAIATLAALVARLACGCWADLGTDESHDIVERADEVFKAMLLPSLKPAATTAGDEPKPDAERRA